MEIKSLQLVVCPAFYPGAESICQGLSVLALEGVKSVELNMRATSYFDCHNPNQIDKLVHTLSQIPLTVNSIHAPFGSEVDFSSFNDTIHEHGVDGQIEAIEIARLLGASYVVVHASDGQVIADRRKRLDRARGVLRELATVAEEADIKLAVENLPDGFLCCDVEEICSLIETINSPNVGVCFDTGHANITGCLNRWAESLLPFAISVHVHDNDGETDQHLFPGLGSIDWRNFMRIYRESGCEADLTLECRPPKEINWRDAFGLVRGCLNF